MSEARNVASNYAASKAGLIALAKSIAQEVGSRGIRANAIAPGFIETAMTAALPEDVRSKSALYWGGYGLFLAPFN